MFFLPGPLAAPLYLCVHPHATLGALHVLVGSVPVHLHTDNFGVLVPLVCVHVVVVVAHLVIFVDVPDLLARPQVEKQGGGSSQRIHGGESCRVGRAIKQVISLCHEGSVPGHHTLIFF